MSISPPAIPSVPGQNLVTTVADLLFSTADVDAVSVLNGFTQVLDYARPVRATVRQPSRLLDHPIETGQLITDYSIILPAEIDLTVIVQAANYRSTYQEILDLFQTKPLLTVQLKVGNFINMVVADIPHEEIPEKFDAFQMIIKFRQVLVVDTTPPFSPANPNQADTQALGQQGSVVATPVASSPFVPSEDASSGISYSSVQNTTPPSYGINGISASPPAFQGPGGAPFTGAQTLTSQSSIQSAFVAGAL